LRDGATEGEVLGDNEGELEIDGEKLELALGAAVGELDGLAEIDGIDDTEGDEVGPILG
jgi:hypothetical protein